MPRSPQSSASPDSPDLVDVIGSQVYRLDSERIRSQVYEVLKGPYGAAVVAFALRNLEAEEAAGLDPETAAAPGKASYYLGRRAGARAFLNKLHALAATGPGTHADGPPAPAPDPEE